METIRKMLSLVVMATLVLSLSAVVGVAAPQERDSAMDERTEQEVATMDTTEGAQARWLQLQKSLARNVMAGDQAVEAVVTRNPQANVSEMTNILAELEVIRKEASDETRSLPDDAQQLAKKFVTMKAEAMNRSRDFREMAQERLPRDDIEDIRERVREQVRNGTGELGELDQQIRERIREHNAERVEQVLTNMGVENNTLVQKVRSGELNPGEAVSQVAREYRGLGEDQREQAKGRLQNANAQEQSRVQSAVEDAGEGLGQRMRNRAQHREAEVREQLGQVRDRISSNLPDHVRNDLGGSMGPPTDMGGGQTAPGGETGENTSAGGMI